MIKIRKSNERGSDDKGWLQTFHTFSFDTYYDPDFLHFRDLRVLNEDTLVGGKGFAAHSHRDMEIVTYVLEGALEHKDSIGNSSVLRPGEVLRMSAGSGVTHSEYNLSSVLPVHFFQIWIHPEQNGLEPSYVQKLFSSAAKWGQWCLMVSSNGRDGSLKIHQDADIYATLLDANDEITFDALVGRYYWIQIVNGKFQVQSKILEKGDAAMVSDETTLLFRCLESGEVLLFDLN